MFQFVNNGGLKLGPVIRGCSFHTSNFLKLTAFSLLGAVGQRSDGGKIKLTPVGTSADGKVNVSVCK